MTGDDNNWGLPQRRHKGFCRICCSFADMTFEHIPPKVALNRNTVRSVSYATWSQHDDIREFPTAGSRQHQKGTGGYVLCERCNNTTGRLWVKEYGRWASGIGSELQRHGPLPEPPPGAHHRLKVRIADVYPGRFARQVLAMLLAVSGGPAPSANNPPVQRILLEGAAELPGDLRMFMRFYVGPHIRLLPITGSLNLKTRSTEVSVEMAFPPFAFVGIVSGEPREEHGLEITDWTELGARAKCNVELDLPVGFGFTPFPGDYRTAQQIISQRSA